MSKDKVKITDYRVTRKEARENPDKEKEIEEYFTPQFGQGMLRTPPKINIPSNSSENENLVLGKNLSNSSLSLSTLIKRSIENHNEQNIEVIQPVAMAAQTVKVRDTLSFIPEFDGTNIPLEDFLEACKDARAMVDETAEPALVKYIRMKVKGEAKTAMVDQAFETIGALSTFLKGIYAPAKTVPELLGELGGQFQQANESVVSFANRVRRLGARVLEAQKTTTNQEITNEFCNYVNSTIVGCFKRGLKAEIENKMAPANDVAELVQSAIKAEREVNAKAQLRSMDRATNFQKSSVNVKRILTTTSPQSCGYCKKTNHTENVCFKKQNDIIKLKGMASTMNCQICSKPGHTAKQCGGIEI